MKKIVLFSFLISLLFISSCKKNQLGGNSTISGKVVHHNKAIANASVFIKFNASEFPGEDTLSYDSKVRADENGFYNIDCYKGDYYVYGYGYDFAIPYPYIVVGGTPVNVRGNEDVDINIAVTED